MYKHMTLLLMLSLVLVGHAQTCNTTSMVASTPSARFTDNGNGIVTDNATTLTWKRCVEGMTWSGADCIGEATTYTWQGALQVPDAVNTGGGFAGYTDWRVPSVAELESIFEVQCISPAINGEIFPGTPSSYFWSSTPRSFVRYSGSGLTWMVDFGGGISAPDHELLDGAIVRDNSLYLRLVRAGQ